MAARVGEKSLGGENLSIILRDAGLQEGWVASENSWAIQILICDGGQGTVMYGRRAYFSVLWNWLVRAEYKNHFKICNVEIKHYFRILIKYRGQVSQITSVIMKW